MRQQLLAAALGLALAGTAHAAVLTVHADLAAWQAAAGAGTLQDFSSFANGDSLSGVQLLPGVTAATNLGTLEVFGGGKTMAAFGSGTGSRAAGNAYYELDLGNAYRALALDISAFESALPPFNVSGGAVTNGLLRLTFQDGTDVDLVVSPGSGISNIFIGLTADTAITRARWIEALEASGGNEETALDNLRVGLAVNPVPEPSSLLLAGAALALLARSRRG